MSAPLAAAEPVIPDFGSASDCVQENGTFCTEWVRDNWDAVLGPALVQHIELTAIAVGIGLVISLALALVTYRLPRLELPVGWLAAFLFTIPSLALFQLLVPITGLSRATVEVALVSYTLLILYRNILTGLRSAPPDVIEAAYGMGLTRLQVLRRVELPLALPAILAGIRLATVSTVALATVAAFVIPEGLGRPIFVALRTYFKTEFIAAGLLAVALGLAADAALVLLGRVVTPWARVRRTA